MSVYKRKLGPRDIGRSKYKGTGTSASSMSELHLPFLKERIFYQSKSPYFIRRKSANPIEIGETVSQIGKIKNYDEPKWMEDIRNMPHSPLAVERPFFTDYDRHRKYESVPKLPSVSDLSVKPIGWEPIDYHGVDDHTSFLEENMWFSSSKIKWDIVLLIYCFLNSETCSFFLFKNNIKYRVIFLD